MEKATQYAGRLVAMIVVDELTDLLQHLDEHPRWGIIADEPSHIKKAVLDQAFLLRDELASQHSFHPGVTFSFPEIVERLEALR